ncbi:phage GP46 family protein [uncultured Parasutterella sp.]|uniref:phage GP46 family protein n=1 Tax=uncultured Parasutterella sp. TaxID=1263098 RepID=UPI002594C3A9|nr:phage GP46 family protein [uncultured Parasutterella sp.]
MECLINGKTADITEYQADELVQATLISLFSWRKSNDDDGVDIPNRQGWWGDTFASETNDRIGSRLWLLRREKLTDDVVARAREYAKESLQWMIDDALASAVNVSTDRENNRLNMSVEIVRPGDAQSIQARFQNLWEQ